jgi:outer membrane protein, heavy metal efflux system
MRVVSRRALLFLASAIVVPWTGADAQSLSEADAVARALASAPRLRVANALPDQVAAEARARRALPNPTVRVQEENAAGFRDRFVLVDQELPLSGRRGLLAKAATSAVSVATAHAASEADLVRRETRTAYATLLGAQARERILGDGLASLEAVTERLRAREQAGEGSAFDRLRAEREHADFADDRRANKAAITAAQAQLAALLGIADGGSTLTATDDPARLPAVVALPDALQQARARRPAVRAADAEIARLQFERQAAARLGWPQPAVSGGWKQTDDGSRSDDGYALSVGLALPLFARGAAEKAAASSALVGAQARRESVLRDIDADVRTVHARAEVGTARVRAYDDEALTRSRELVRIASLAYEEGEIGILELLDAHRTRLGAELRSLDLRVEARFAAIDLDFATAEEVIR